MQIPLAVTTLLVLIFFAASLVALTTLGSIDWSRYYGCFKFRNVTNWTISCNTPRPDSLRLSSSLPIVEIIDGQLVTRDANPHEMYVISEERWNALHWASQRALTEAWLSFKKNNSHLNELDASHAFYEQHLNDIISQFDQRETVLNAMTAPTVTEEILYCGTVYRQSNPSFFHDETCTCNNPLKKEIRVRIGPNLHLCTDSTRYTPLLDTPVARRTPMTVPTLYQFDAPVARSLSRITYNPNQKFALTPSLDGLIPQ